MAIFYNKTEDFLVKEVQNGTNKLGILHHAYEEQMPTFETAGCEFVYPDVNYATPGGGERKLNCQIVFGRDRPSHLLSGYGKVGGTPCASIDIVAGRMSAANKRKGIFKKFIDPVKRETVVGNNFALDASRIYISQKCDIDHYFGLPPGDSGRKRGEAAIGIKSDHVRVIGRETVKIHAGSGQFQNIGKKGELNANGKKLASPKIEFIVGTRDPQPLILGSNMAELLDEMLNQIGSLRQALLMQNTNMIKIKTALAAHFHTGVGVVAPDPILGTILISDMPMESQKIANNITKALNFEILKLNYLGIGLPDMKAKHKIKTEKNILSSHVLTT